MKTIEKKQYVTPKLDVVLVELEEGIAQTSVMPGANPSSNAWEEGGSGSLSGSGDFEDGAF